MMRKKRGSATLAAMIAIMVLSATIARLSGLFSSTPRS
jgi:hypothetical protein